MRRQITNAGQENQISNIPVETMKLIRSKNLINAKNNVICKRNEELQNVPLLLLSQHFLEGNCFHHERVISTTNDIKRKYARRC